ncbi:TetR/AcrR family transcriptional regulator C-terminal domain-containing protein [Plastorhodobacter daqingensis]|uniref:TetR/AcrR family transcriptional regulator C-terminal domain-containing protein n=1 Tax=Plastorhodobacter daqingensis TaxID=1387281 RepID=A0ABW2UQ98_9RHOB
MAWERADPVNRAPPTPLTRRKVVAAAIFIADAEGLSAVTIRKVAAASNSAPMRLYSYFETKEELIELMVDEVFGEMLTKGPMSGDWRAVARAVAYRIRAAWLQHRWFIDALGGRPPIGPNALRFMEDLHAGLARDQAFARIDLAMQAVATLVAFVTGALRMEGAELAVEASNAEWQERNWPYLQRQIATGQFPMMEEIVSKARHSAPDKVFGEGLEIVLNGLSALLEYPPADQA